MNGGGQTELQKYLLPLLLPSNSPIPAEVLEQTLLVGLSYVKFELWGTVL